MNGSLDRYYVQAHLNYVYRPNLYTGYSSYVVKYIVNKGCYFYVWNHELFSIIVLAI